MRIDKVFLGFFASIAEAKKSNQCSFRAQPKKILSSCSWSSWWHVQASLWM